MSTAAARVAPPPALLRLFHLAELPADDLARLQLCVSKTQWRAPARRELYAEGQAIGAPVLFLSGWAARMRLLADGRRQILSLLLPGDLIGASHRQEPVALSTIVALTDVELANLPARTELAPGSAIVEAYDAHRTLEHFYLLAQITRLGRLNAYDRIGDFLLEMCERLDLAGFATRGRFPLPLTQEMLADTLGLTSVHVNRTLQAMRRDGTLTLQRGVAMLHDGPALPRAIDHHSAHVARVKLGSIG